MTILLSVLFSIVPQPCVNCTLQSHKTMRVLWYDMMVYVQEGTVLRDGLGLGQSGLGGSGTFVLWSSTEQVTWCECVQKRQVSLILEWTFKQIWVQQSIEPFRLGEDEGPTYTAWFHTVDPVMFIRWLYHFPPAAFQHFFSNCSNPKPNPDQLYLRVLSITSSTFVLAEALSKTFLPITPSNQTHLHSSFSFTILLARWPTSICGLI